MMCRTWVALISASFSLFACGGGGAPGQHDGGDDGGGGGADAAPSFDGSPLDLSPPSILSVTATAHTTVEVLFSENLAASSIVASNFQIQGDNVVPVHDATLDADEQTVLLSVAAGMIHGANYTLLADAIVDLADNEANDLTANFIGRGAVVADITGAPAALGNVDSASIAIAGQDIVSYQYALTTPSSLPVWSAEIDVAQTIDLSNLEDGPYLLEVVGKDTLGNWQANVDATTASWQIDTVAPTAELDGLPNALTNLTGATITVSGDDVEYYKYSLDGGAWSAATGVSSAVELTSLAEGAHSIAVIGGDLAGNWQDEGAASSFDWEIDVSAPTAVLSGTPDDPTSATSASVTVGGLDIVSYAYALDGGAYSAFTAVATPIELTSLADGTHTLEVIGRDSANNTQDTAFATTHEWVVDTAAPTAELSNLPANPTYVQTTAIVVGGVGVTRYRYRIDGGAWTGRIDSATSIDLADLVEGSHTLDVAGIDAADNEDLNNPVSYTWTIDITAPLATLDVTIPAADPSMDDGFAAAVSGTDVVAYKYRVDGGAWSAETPVATSIVLSGLAEGAHSVEAIGRDLAGNWQDAGTAASYGWTIDQTAPTAELDNLPVLVTNDQSLAVSVSGTDVVAYKYRLDGGAWSSSTPIATTIQASSLAAGSHTLDVIGADVAGNWQDTGAPTSYTWTIDLNAETAVLSDLPSDPTNSTSAAITVGGTGVVSYRYRLDGGAWSGFAAVATPISLSSLSESSHTIDVQARDAALNVQVTPTSYTWTVDVTAPTATLTGTPSSPTNATSLSVTVGGTGVVQYKYRLDGGAYGSAQTVATALAESGIAAGSHTLDVIGVDAAGNWQSVPTSHTWTLDLTAPTPPSVSDTQDTIGDAGVYDNELLLTFTWTNPGDAAEVALQVATDSGFTNIVLGGSDGTSMGTAQSYDYIVDADDGPRYYARVRVRDAAGNWSSFGTASNGIDVVGAIAGRVKDTTLANVSGASVALVVAGNTINTTTTNGSGDFGFSNVPIGHNYYTLEVTKTGYLSASKNNVTVSVGATIDVGVIYLVSSSASAGKITGRAVDANDGANISGASIAVYDWEGTLITTVTSAGNGTFDTGTVNAGVYTLVLSKTGYFDLSVDSVVVNGDKNVDRQAMCEVLTEPHVRVVLQWGATPNDLDLHVVGPSDKTVSSDGTPNNRFHVFWSSQKSFNENTGGYASGADPNGSSSTTSLVQDDTSSYGPEAINLFGFGSGYAYGTYTFTVHKWSSGGTWYDYPVTLRVYDSEGLVQEIAIANDAGTNRYWQAFKLNITGAGRANRSLSVVNTFGSLTHSSKSSMDW